MNEKDIPKLDKLDTLDELETIAKELDQIKPVLGLVLEKENGEWDIIDENTLKKEADCIRRISSVIKYQNEIADAINKFSETVRYHIYELKKLLLEYFSDEIQNDETPMGVMKRNQIRKELLEFANKH